MHHLPESRRYPDTPADWAEAMARHAAVASCLLGKATPVWRIEVCTVRECARAKPFNAPR